MLPGETMLLRFHPRNWDNIELCGFFSMFSGRFAPFFLDISKKLTYFAAHVSMIHYKSVIKSEGV